MNHEQRLKKIAFWHKVKAYADKHLSELHGSSVKCPRCNTWSYQTETMPTWVGTGDGDGAEVFACAQCGNHSLWVEIGFGIMHCLNPDVNFPKSPDKPSDLTPALASPTL